MCTEANKTGPWQTELPQSEGDHFWLQQWGCGCVVRSGISYVRECEEGPPDEDSAWAGAFTYRTKEDKLMAISWEGQEPTIINGKPEIHYWMPVVLPPPLDD